MQRGFRIISEHRQTQMQNQQGTNTVHNYCDQEICSTKDVDDLGRDNL